MENQIKHHNKKYIKNILHYLWQNQKTEPITRKALFLQKSKLRLKYERTKHS